MAVVSEGHRNRRVGSHEMNMDSSRSHSLLTLHLESESIDPDDGHMMVKFGKMVFVDLAGSERLKESKAMGVTLTETGAINKSLFTLGKVISQLAKKAKGKGGGKDFVPYRDSKLTKLLMDSLGGSCMTLMIACCSPAESFLEETLSTLNYATRARNIQNRPMVQMDPKEQLIFNLRQEAKLLRLENEFLRQQLAGHNGGVLPPRLYSAPGSPGMVSGAGSGGGSSGTPRRASRQSSGQGGGGGQRGKRGTPPSSPRVGGPPGLSRGQMLPSMPNLPPGLGGQGGGMRAGSGGSGTGSGGPSRTNSRAGSMSGGDGGSGGGGGSSGTPSRPPRAMSPREPRIRSSSTSSSSSSSSSSSASASDKAGDAQMQKMLSTYKREIERLKTENREVRARGSVAERGYRAVMAENERLCNKLEHLEEIFVHQARQAPWPSGAGGGKNPSSSSSSSSSSSNSSKNAGDHKLLRHLKAENSALRVRLQRLERDGGPGSPKGSGKQSKFVNADGVGGSKDSRQVRVSRSLFPCVCVCAVLRRWLAHPFFAYNKSFLFPPV